MSSRLEIVYDPDALGAVCVMHFRLVYEGELLGATQRSPRAEHKHRIRRLLDPQLRALWQGRPNLMGIPSVQADGSRDYPHSPEKLAERFRVGSYKCVPLVMESDKALVSLDVLFLRPGPLGVILPNTGDLDNRISTVFDALQVPPVGTDFGEFTNPSPSEEILYCLVQNDKLISRVSVETDTLLNENYMLSAKNPRPPNHALLIISVEVRALWSGAVFSRF